MRGRRGAWAGCGVALALLGACGASEDSWLDNAPDELAYVAVGDSFAAGPRLEPLSEDQPGCGRSQVNYPARLAAMIGVGSFADRSCAGARTTALTEGQPVLFGGGAAAPQLDAITSGTDLVTVTIGVNDDEVFAALVRCLQPALGGCQAGEARNAVAAAEHVAGPVASALEEAESRAPGAKILVVGYPAMTPRTGTCEAIGGSALATGRARDIEAAVEESLVAAAEQAHVTFVSLRAASADHDLCSHDPWVNGAAPSADGASPWHPTAAGMQAIAEVVHAALE